MYSLDSAELSALTDALYEAELDEVTVRESYSGRGMYGTGCLGLVGPEAQLAQAEFELAVLVAHDPEDVSSVREAFAELSRSRSTDSFGRDVVLYWKNVTATTGDAEPTA